MPSSLTAIVRRAVPNSIYRRYRQRKISSQISRYETRDVTHSYAGNTLRVRLADPLAEGWYDRDWDEPPVIAFLRDRGVLAPGATVFDLGAHQAIVALMLARVVGDTGHVVAVEAEPHNARIAEFNREQNDAENLTVIHAAGAETEGFTSFAEGLNGHVDEHATIGTVTVRTVTVDALAEQYRTPDLVFIDVEGYEEHVLNGATRTLANSRTSFVVEVHEALTAFGGSADELAARFRAFDRYVATGEQELFKALEGAPPHGRFFLIAIPRQTP